MLLRRRSNNLPRYPGKLMMIPGFTFQPREAPEDLRKELSIVEQVKCEYLEELFNMESKVRMGSASTIPEGKYLEGLLNKGGAKLLFTEVAVPLRELWPEIGMMLLITDTEWSEMVKGKHGHRPITANWEYQREGTVSFGGRGSVPLLPSVTETIGPWTEFVDPCAPAVVCGREVAMEVLQLKR